jgi:RND superfamily putative drug exporter
VDRAALERVVAAVRTQPNVASVSAPRLIPDNKSSAVALVEVYPHSAPQDSATTTLVDHLRRQTLPEALGRSGPRVYIGGETASTVDFTEVVSPKLPYFIGVVVLLSLLLLAIVFRSLVIPIISAAMNIVSVGAAVGIVVAVFQWGWLGTVFGVNRTGPVETYFPIFLFAVLFGLSTDYQVFLVSRVHEEYLKTGDNALAVRRGLATTGGVITAAALIMILVFGSFIFGGQQVIREFGLFLAGGILVDAVVIRMAIVPGLLLLTRRWNWSFPLFLQRRLPQIDRDRSLP